MANAKKCDVCDKLYERYNTKGTKPNSFRLTQEYRLQIGGNYAYTSIKEFDCCPACMDSIQRHIEWIKLNRNVQAIVDVNGCMREPNKE